MPKKRHQLHLELPTYLHEYVRLLALRLGIKQRQVHIFALEYFRSLYPLDDSRYVLLCDQEKLKYVVLRMVEGQPFLEDTGTYTTTELSLLLSLREKYPSIRFGRKHVP